MPTFRIDPNRISEVQLRDPAASRKIINDLNQGVIKLESELESKDAELKKLSGTLDATRKQLDAVNADSAGLKAELSRRDAELAQQKKSVVDLSQAVQKLQGELTSKDLELVRVTATADAGKKQFEGLAMEVGSLKAVLAAKDAELSIQHRVVGELMAKISTLEKELQSIEAKARPKFAMETLVQQFRNDIDRLNREALSSANPSMVVESLEVDLRAGIDVSQGLKLTQIPDHILAAGNVSSLRFQLKPATAVRIVDDD